MKKKIFAEIFLINPKIKNAESVCVEGFFSKDFLSKQNNREEIFEQMGQSGNVICRKFQKTKYFLFLTIPIRKRKLV